MTDDLKARLRTAALMLPIRRNDTADYAEVFGQDFQAMTMTPERFEALSALPEAADRIEALEAALARIKHLMPDDHTLFAESARYIARAALAGGGE